MKKDKPTSGIESLDWRDRECIKAYAEYNMSAVAAARGYYMHRATMHLHLKRVREKTGLDPLNFFDLVKLLELIKE